MPVTTTLGRLRDRLTVIANRVSNPELAQELAQALADDIGLAFIASGLHSESGALFEAVTTVNPPERVTAGWTVSVMDGDAIGKPSESAPQGTLREFFEDYPEASAKAWRFIPQQYKKRLAQMRRAGMYGGKGPTYANYAWAQEYGNSRAFIAPRHFIQAGHQRWLARRNQIIDEWWRRVKA